MVPRGMSGGPDSSDAAGSGSTWSRTLSLPPPAPTPAGPSELPERYEDLGVIGRGGMGEVRRVRDLVLGRVLAMKLTRWAALGEPAIEQRFLREARIIAGLQHPGIVPLHDAGVLHDGRLWYTMPEIRGETFAAHVRALHAQASVSGWSGGAWTLRRLVAALEEACRAVAYAHARGVLHRDLKPSNLMIGAFGEVQVLDWGLARLSGASALPTGSFVSGDALATSAGQVLGTPAWMAPEQARGEAGPEADVYALGAVLYTLLMGRPPFQGDARQALAALRAGPSPGVTPLPDLPPPPPPLVALCAWAMQRAPRERPDGAQALATELRSWLEGRRRQERALELVGRAESRLPEAEALRERAAAKQADAAAAQRGLPSSASIEEKRPVWDLEDAARSLRLSAVEAETQAEQLLQSALNHAPGLERAHARLADLYRLRLERAERLGDDDEAARATRQLLHHDRGRHRGWLRSGGALTLVTDPPGAQARLFRYAQEGRRLVPRFERALGETPLIDVALPRGSWLVLVEAPGCVPLRYPVCVGRGERWDGVPPRAQGPAALRLAREGELGPGELLVPAGWFLCGGDPEAFDGLSRRRVWVDSVVIQRSPVTQAEHLRFLNALVEAGRGEEAERCAPAETGGRAERVLATLRRGPDGRFHPVEGTGPLRWQAEAPVCLVDWPGAQAYAAWRAAQDGLPWRLPHALEWEKAARGVDGRAYPWGDHFEPSWACMGKSHVGRPAPSLTEGFPEDEGPYGLRGAAGNVRDWCLNPYSRLGLSSDGARLDPHQTEGADLAYRELRGGSWSTSSSALCRLASRFGAKPEVRPTSSGFRLLRPGPSS